VGIRWAAFLRTNRVVRGWLSFRRAAVAAQSGRIPGVLRDTDCCNGVWMFDAECAKPAAAYRAHQLAAMVVGVSGVRTDLD